jgi:hypothetical protein
MEYRHTKEGSKELVKGFLHNFGGNSLASGTTPSLSDDDDDDDDVDLPVRLFKGFHSSIKI